VKGFGRWPIATVGQAPGPSSETLHTSSGFDNVRLCQVSLTQQTYRRYSFGALGAMKPTIDANDLPPKRPECLSRLAPSRGNLAGISSL